MSSATVTLQCVASMAGTLLGETLGSSLPAKLIAGILGALIGAFLTAPGRHRRRRIVAVAIVLALLAALRRAGTALAAERRGAWIPANWTVVGLTALAGFTGGSAVTTARGGWDDGRLVTVPQVRGQERTAALGVLSDAGLEVTTGSEPSESIAEGSATRTDPAGGTTVDEDADVTLYIASGPPGATVTIPNVTGRERGAATALLQDQGLRARVRREPSDSIASDHATRTDPPAGTRVDRGARVTLLISSGSATQTATVPDVRGQPRADALARLRDAGLRPSIRTEPSREVAEGSATRTDPAGGTEVERNAEVTLFVSSGPPTARVELPDVAGRTRDDAFLTLEDLGLRPTAADEPSSTVAAGTVVRTDPAAGTLVDAGSTVTVVVSSGPPPLVVPDVAGLRSRPAESLLKKRRLVPDESFEKSDLAGDIVIGTDPVAGTEVDPGDTVTVRISCGPNDCVD